MNDRLVPKADYYRIQEPINLERECAEYFIQILNTDPIQHSAILPDRTESFYVSQLLQPDADQLGSSEDTLPLLRISQTLAIPASAELSLKPGDQGTLKTTSDEYQVLSLEMSEYSDDDYDDEVVEIEDLDWHGRVAVIIKPADNESELEINIVNQQTGEALSLEETIDLIALLSVWQEDQRYTEFSAVLRGDTYTPRIISRDTGSALAGTYSSFVPGDFIKGESCPKCSLEQIPCSHQGFEHNAN